jgi:putative membrane protein
MLNLIVNWLLSALSLVIVAHVIRGFEVSGFGTALIAALVIGLVNATIGLFVKIVTFPLTLISLGVFWFVINAIMLKLAAAVVPGFQIQGFLPAFFGAIVLSLVNLFFKVIASRLRDRDHVPHRSL